MICLMVVMWNGCVIWYRILEAVAELARAKPAEGERMN